MDPEELQSSEENERARRAREIAQAGLTAYRQGISMPDEVPYMLAAPQAPAEPVEVFTNDVWPPVAPSAQQQVPSTPSEPVGTMSQRQDPMTPSQDVIGPAPAPTRATAVGAPVPSGMVNLGPVGAQQAPAPEQQGVGVLPPEMYVNPNAGAANQLLGESYDALRERAVYTGIPTRTRSVQTFNTPGPVSAEASGALTASDEAYKAALRARAEANARGFGQQGEIFEGADLQSQLEAQRQQQAAEDQAREMRWQTQRADNINRQVLGGQIDPNRVLGDSFSGGRIAAALGLFVAGLAQGQEGANAFLQNINQVIDRDIAAQLANLDNMRAGAQNQQNLVGMYRTVFGDETAAREAARATMLQSVAQKLQAQQARMGQAGQGPALQLALAELERAKAAATVAAQQAQGATVSTRTRDIRTGGTVGGPNYRLSTALRQLGTDVNAAGVANQRGVQQAAETAGQLQQRASASRMTPATSNRVVDYGTRRGALNQSLRRLERINELVTQTTSGLPWSVLGAPGTGPIGTTGPAFTSEGRELNSLLNDVVADYLLAKTGKVAAAWEVANARNLNIGQVSQDLPNRLGAMAQRLEQTRRDLDATYGPEVTSAYEQNVNALPPPLPEPIQ